MRVEFVIALQSRDGQKRVHLAGKAVDLDFIPVPGMLYCDEATLGAGRKIVTVSIQNNDGQISILAALEPERCVNEIAYRAAGWIVGGTST